MRCLHCNHDTDVYDSRPSDAGYRRKRKCRSCGFRFATLEVVDEARNLNAPRPPKAPKKPVVKRQKKVRLPKAPSSKPIKPRDPDDDVVLLDDYDMRTELMDVARDLGIEGFK